MAKKTVQTDEISEIKKSLEKGEVVIGIKNTLALLRNNKLASVYITNNCPKDIQDDIHYYADINGTKVFPLSITNEDLGTICKKQFPIAVLSVRR